MNRLTTALERIGLTAKLATGFGLLGLLGLLIGGYSLVSQRQLNADLQTLYADPLQAISQLREAQVNFAVLGRALRQYVLAQDGVERDRGKQALLQAESGLRKNLDTLRSRLDNPEERLQVGRFEEKFAAYKRNLDRVMALHERDRYNSADGRALLGGSDFQLVAVEAAQQLGDLVRHKEEQARRLAGQGDRRFEQAQATIAWLLGGGLVVGILGMLLIGRSISDPNRRLAQVVDRLADGQFELDVPMTDYPNEIGGLARSVEVLKSGARDMAVQRWVKTHEAELGTALQGADNFIDLAQRYFSAIGPLLQIGHGAFYIHEENFRRLRLLTGYAWPERKALNQHVRLGEGLVGQCAIERQSIMIAEAPDGYLDIASSLGESTPRCIVVLPILHGDRLLGVIELASFRRFSRNESMLLESSLPVLAIGLENFERNTRTQQLLEQTQAQAESVEAQAQQLEGQKVELETRQAELADTEAWYRGIIEAAPDGMLITDEDGCIILVNPHAAAMFGYAIDELLGGSVDQLVPAVAREKHGQLRENYLWDDQSNRPMGIDRSSLRGLRKDGSEFAIEVNLARLPAVGNRGACICAALRDVSERRRMEQAVRDSELRIRQVLDNSPAGVSIMTDDGRPIYTNKRLATLLGVSAEEMRLRRSSEFWAEPEDRAHLLERLAREGQVSDFETRFRRADGSLLTMLLSCAIVDLADGRHVVSWFYDVTALKDAETALSDARRRAEAATRTKSEFLANVSHEIRTPMNAIIGMSHLVLQGELSLPQRKQVEKVHQAAQGLLKIINNILDFSRLDAGSLEHHRDVFVLAELLDIAAAPARAQAAAKGLSLVLQLDPAIPAMLEGDARYLQQIVGHLADNAVKFTAEGGIEIGARLVDKDMRTARVAFTVSDSGCGLEPAQRERLAAAFSQADTANSRGRDGGTGLGLVIVNGLVQALGGELEIDSTPKLGSTFRFVANFGLPA